MTCDELINLENKIINLIIYHGLSYDEAEKLALILKNKLEKQ
jgi:hypothetical protein